MNASTSDSTRRRFAAPQEEGPRAHWRQLLPYLSEHKRVLILVVALSVLGSAAFLAQPLLVSQVITVIEAGQPLGGLAWLLVGLVVVSGLISGYQHYLLQRTGEGVVLSSRRKLVSRLLNLPIREFDMRRTGDLVSRVGSDTTLLRAVLTQGVVQAIGGGLTFIGAIVAMLIIDPLLLSITVLVIFGAIATVATLSTRVRVATHKAQTRVGELAASVERALSGIRTVRASNATAREVAAIGQDAEGAWRMGVKVAKISSLIMPVSSISMQVSFMAVLGIGGYRVASGAIAVADLVAFILFLFMMIMPLGQAFGAIASVNQALGALGRIQEIIDLPSESEADRDVVPAAPIATDDAITFENVSFSYPAEARTPDGLQNSSSPSKSAAAAPTDPAPTDHMQPERAAELQSVATEAFSAVGSTPTAPVGPQTITAALATALRPEAAALAEPPEALVETAETLPPRNAVLHEVSFGVPRGRRTALVGPSGAGKSTIFALVERFYDPTAGVVRVGGEDIRALDRSELRAQIGYVEQDAPALAGSLRDNLTLGAPDASDERCIEVLRAVNLSEVLERDERGLGAPVGENGVMLSGGERQRLAIARVLLAAPPILLLDESTSSLDGLNEQRLRDAIDAVAVNRTLIIIAHRLSTVIDADRIVVLDRGRVVGIGTHAELVQSTPLYRDLAKHQLLV